MVIFYWLFRQDLKLIGSSQFSMHVPAILLFVGTSSFDDHRAFRFVLFVRWFCLALLLQHSSLSARHSVFSFRPAG